MIMNTTIRKFTYFLTACLLGCLTGYAYEQDNWYLHGPIDGNLSGVFHQEYNATAKKDMLYKNVTGVGLEVRDINGSLLQTINTGGITFTDIDYDQNASRLFGINASKLTCFEQNASGGWSEQWRSTQAVTTMAQGPSGKLFCANNGSKIYVFEQNGTMSDEFGWVDGINSLSNFAHVIGFFKGGHLVVSGNYTTSGSGNNYKLFVFTEDGSFLKSEKNLRNDWASDGQIEHALNHEGVIVFRYRAKSYHGWSYAWHSLNLPSFSFVSPQTVSLWLQNGDFIAGASLYRRTFRTKMETNHNSVPQPVIHRIAQRTGTNVMELDFEVIDTDDDNVTVGILAYCGSDKLVPQAWLNGSGSKIGTPIATNTVHTMEWDVKQDWPDSTGSIKFEILCQDGSRDKPVDLHFLKLPFADGNMTISRSPLKDSDFVNYAKFLLATGQAQFESNTSNEAIIPEEANTTEMFTFTNCGATGRIGPTEAQIQAEYNGTNLHNQVTTGWKSGYQEWTVPAAGDYWIEAVGAAGGFSPNRTGGMGAFVRGKFSLVTGQKLNILVGQRGASTIVQNTGAGGGGGTFVVADSNNTPLVVAGGGGGAGPADAIFHFASLQNNGEKGYYDGGLNGLGGTGERGAGGGGFRGSGTGGGARAGQSYQLGGQGGSSSSGRNGGFGGGGATERTEWTYPGGGGGYSGGGGSQYGQDPRVSGGGGSFNSGSNQTNLWGYGGIDGLVRIYKADDHPTLPSLVIINRSLQALGGYAKLFLDLGPEYRIATSAEVTKAREAATPGGVNKWTATNQVKPRNLPSKVNEYGFDVYTTWGFWVIKE